MSDAPIYPHTVQDGERDRLRLACNACGKSVSSPFYPVKTETPDGGLIVRAWIECPECLEKRTALRAALAALEAKWREIASRPNRPTGFLLCADDLAALLRETP